MDTEQKAARARRLLHDEHFRSLVNEIGDGAVRAFLSADDPGSPEVREAHALSRAIRRVEAMLQGDLDAETIEHKRKGQHRGHD